MNQLVKKIKPKDTVREFVCVMNGILNLASRELDILVELIEEDLKYEVDDEDVNVASKTSKKLICDKLSINSSTFTKCLGILKEKNCVKMDKDKNWRVNKSLRPIVIGNRIVQISIVLKLD